MAKLTSVDEAAALPARHEMARENADLGLYDAAINEMPTECKIEMARSGEVAARGFDSRIANSEGSACSTTVGKIILVNSAGFTGEYPATTCALMVAPIAKEGDQMQVAAWGDRQRALTALDSPEELGREAARRALRRLNGQKFPPRKPRLFLNLARPKNCWVIFSERSTVIRSLDARLFSSAAWAR